VRAATAGWCYTCSLLPEASLHMASCTGPYLLPCCPPHAHCLLPYLLCLPLPRSHACLCWPAETRTACCTAGLLCCLRHAYCRVEDADAGGGRWGERAAAWCGWLARRPYPGVGLKISWVHTWRTSGGSYPFSQSLFYLPGAGGGAFLPSVCCCLGCRLSLVAMPSL